MEDHDPGTVWRSNYPTVSELAEKVEEVLQDQVKRRQVVELSEEDARRQYPGLVIASLGANRKEKSDGTITARVLHDGSNGRAVIRRTRVRDQERLETRDALEGEEKRKNVGFDGRCEEGPSPNLAAAWLPCPARH